MFDRNVFELKVGLFVIIGLIIFLIVLFSIGDININQNGYSFNIIFSFVDGVSGGSPVQYAGVAIGYVKGVDVYFDKEMNRNMAKLNLWINNEHTKIEKDSRIIINTLGLLGEKYIEIFPGTPSSGYIKKDDNIRGSDPILMCDVTEKFNSLADTASTLMDDVKSGKGTVGQLFVNDSLYKNIDSLTYSAGNVFSKMDKGQGTLGQFLTNPSIYDNLEEFTADIKSNPWKLMNKPKGE